MTPNESIGTIRHMAREELRKEALREAIDAEKVRIKARQTLRGRLAALLPFTITWKST